jgi:hypothetical protein
MIRKRDGEGGVLFRIWYLCWNLTFMQTASIYQSYLPIPRKSLCSKVATMVLPEFAIDSEKVGRLSLCF